MASIVRRRRGGSAHYYLRHATPSARREVYLGGSVPPDIGEIRERLVLDMEQERWAGDLERISEDHLVEYARMTEGARREMREQFAVMSTYATQRVEGSSMTLRETADLLLDGAVPDKRPDHERREALAHRDIMLDMMDGPPRRLDLDVLLGWHRSMFAHTDDAGAGYLRRYAVGISGSRVEFPLWEDVPEELDRLFRWHDENRRRVETAELAATMHYRLASVHPFGDGNGRISRLAMNYVLHAGGYPMFIVGMGIRRSYIRALERSQLRGACSPFVLWFLRRYVAANRRGRGARR